jgi:hypothetical protein
VCKYEPSEDWLKRINSNRLEDYEALAWGRRGQEVRRFLTTDQRRRLGAET